MAQGATVDSYVQDNEFCANSSPPDDGMSVRLKIFTVLLIPLFACLFSFVLVDTHYFRKHADPLWVQASSQIFEARNVSCDVVVYGDSTAITGVDSSLVQASTGLRTCNIAQTKASLVVSGTSALDVFLNHNPKPRVLVLQFGSPDFYHSGSWNDTTAYMEGVVNLLRYYPHRKLLRALWNHPEIAFGMMHYAYVTGPLNWFRNKRRGISRQSTPLDVHLVRPTPAYTTCDQVVDIDPIFHRPDASFIQELRAHYARMADHVLIDVSPTSECDSRFKYLQNALSGIDNSIERYPVALFNEGYSHFTEEGARRWSRELTNQLISVAATEPQSPGRWKASAPFNGSN